VCSKVCFSSISQGRIRRGRRGSHGYPCWDIKYKEREKEKKRKREKKRNRKKKKERAMFFSLF